MLPHSHRPSHAALTLVELMMVIVIVGILAGVTAVQLSNVDERARVSAAQQDMRVILDAIGTYKMESGGDMPETLQDLIDGPDDYQGHWQTGFADRQLPKDPWGNPYVYEIVDAAFGEFTLTCLGKDGLPDGEGYNADIVWPAPAE